MKAATPTLLLSLAPALPVLANDVLDSPFEEGSVLLVCGEPATGELLSSGDFLVVLPRPSATL